MRTLKEIALGLISPSKTNPRSDFESDALKHYLEELAATIRKPTGVLQPILVRPYYCAGCQTHEEIERAAAKEKSMKLPFESFEIIAGECRWRASRIADRETIPAIVMDFTDDDALEAQHIENLHRRDLTPLEEAQGIVVMLGLKNDAGTPRYTVASLAEKLGFEVDWVEKRRLLTTLPELAKEAMAEGRLSPKVARLIFTVPSPEKRQEFTARILKPELNAEPLSYQAAKLLRDDLYVKVLRDVPFPLDDADLVPAVGSCAACPKMSGNCPQLFTGDDNAHLKQSTCMEPTCYRVKLAAWQAKKAAAVAKPGDVVLSPDEAEKIYPFFMGNGAMDPKSPYVRIGEKPAEHLLKKEVQKVATWEVLIEDAEEKTGATVPRVMIADQTGAVRPHVDLKLAVALIEKGGEPIFREAPGAALPKTHEDPFAIDKKAELDRAKVRWAVTKAALDAVWAALAKGWDTAAVWDELFHIGMVHAGQDGLGLLAKWRDLKVEDGPFGRADAVEIWRNKLSTAERDCLVPLLLVVFGLPANGIAADEFDGLAKALKVDLGAIEKKAVADLKAKEAGARLKPAELEEKVREQYRAKKSAAQIAVNLGLSLVKVDRILSKIEKENAKALAPAPAPAPAKKPAKGKPAAKKQSAKKGGKEK